MSAALWMGDIDKWMDEAFIYSLFSHTGELTNVKIVRDKSSGQSSGYGFIYFNSPTAAQYVLDNYNGQPIPGTNKVFRLNWAAYGMNTQKRNESQALFVGDLAPDVNEYYLLQTFQFYYPSVYSAKVVTDPHTGMSKGYGFVYFNDDGERTRSLTEMQGFYLSYRPIKVNIASKKNQAPSLPMMTQSLTSGGGGGGGLGGGLGGGGGGGLGLPSSSSLSGGLPVDPNNTTVFVGGIDPSVTHDILRSAFSPFGDIVGIKIPHGKGCGFIEFATHDQAANVLKDLNGAAIIGNSQVRLSWGKANSATKSPTHDTKIYRPPITSSSTSSEKPPVPVTSSSKDAKPGPVTSTSPTKPSSEETTTEDKQRAAKSSVVGVKRDKDHSDREDEEKERDDSDQPSKRRKTSSEDSKK